MTKRELIDALSSSRLADDADVVLYCGRAAYKITRVMDGMTFPRYGEEQRGMLMVLLKSRER